MNEIGDKQLVEAYNRAIKMNLDVEFIKLLKAEMVKRGLR
ncbi:sporulation histidine kinase inhibitor Sda [Salipaludibacillus daqingensis]|nr:sporulation histidine kinase inhibitor Sda [Salipaludibacillus daqingensis]